MATVYDKSSLFLAPSGVSNGTVFVQKPVDGTGDFTFTRGSNLSATRVNEAQLIEKGRENLLKYSEDLTKSQWANIRTTDTSGHTGYDGTANAYKIIPTTDNNTHRLDYVDTWATSQVYTFSFYAKASGYDTIDIVIGGTSIGGAYGRFNLSTGTASNVGASIAASMEDLDSGWYRCQVAQVSGSTTRINIGVNDGTAQSYVGDGTSGVLIQHPQLEQGLVATDYIETTATTGKAGLLENTPRLDYSGGATCPSLLLEPSRANLIAQSEYFESYAQNRVAFVYNATTSPEGLVNGAEFNDTATSGTHYVQLRSGVVGGGVMSFFAKQNTHRYVQAGPSSSISKRVFFDLQDGVMATIGGSAESYYGIEDYGNGWYRCYVAFGDLENPSIFNAAGDGSGSIDNNYTGDGSGVYVYGAQVEQNVSYKTSYIPTYGTSQTRAVDDTGNLDLSLIGLDGQDVTHFIEFKNNQSIIRDSGGTSFRFSSDTANFGSLRIYRSASTARQLTVVFQDNNGDFVPNGYEMTGLNPKVAIKRVWSTGEIKVFVDGNKVIDAASTLYNSWNKVDMEGAGSTIEVKQLVSFPTVLSDLDCEILTGATTYETFDEMALALNYTVYE